MDQNDKDAISTDDAAASDQEADGEEESHIIRPDDDPLDQEYRSKEGSWFALYTRSRFEKKVFSELADRSIDVFLPMREVLSRWKDRKKKVWMPLFPGYVFVHHEDTAVNRYKVLNITGAVRFIGFEGKAQEIPEDQIRAVRRFLEAKISVDPYPYVKVGRRVEITAGSLKGVQGILVQKKGRFRFILQVDLIRQAVSVEIDASDVRPL